MDTRTITWIVIIVVVLLIGFWVWKKFSTRSPQPSPPAAGRRGRLGNMEEEDIFGGGDEGGYIIYFPSSTR